MASHGGGDDGTAAGPLKFEVAIPLVTNPWLWVDMGKGLGVAYVLLTALMLWILRDEPWPEIWPAWRVVTLCVFAVVGLLLAVSLVVFRNRVVARFTLDARGAHYECGTLAARAGAVIGLLSFSPLLAGSGLLARAQSSLFVPWSDVRKVSVFPARHVITLSNAWRPVLRVYCVDAPTYDRALAIVAARTAPRGGSAPPDPGSHFV